MSGNDLTGKLTAMQVKQAKPKDSTYRLSDGRGLNVEIRPNGAKYWRLFYRFRNKQKTLALGVYPVITLSRAREKMLEAKRQLDDGVDPSIYKKQAKASLGQNTFESVATEWFEKQSVSWSKGHADKVTLNIVDNRVHFKAHQLRAKFYSPRSIF